MKGKKCIQEPRDRSPFALIHALRIIMSWMSGSLHQDLLRAHPEGFKVAFIFSFDFLSQTQSQQDGLMETDQSSLMEICEIIRNLHF